jgi:hypothetical protein
LICQPSFSLRWLRIGESERKPAGEFYLRTTNPAEPSHPFLSALPFIPR